MPALEPFEGPRAKIARARKHINEFIEESDVYLSRRPIAIIVAYELVPVGPLTIHFTSIWRERVPPGLYTILGDAIHNLRGALDIMANDVVALSGVTPVDVYFPFAKQEADVDMMIARRMKGAPDDAKLMVKALKPYPAGNPLLRGLHDLDIQDKHLAAISAGGFGQAPAGRYAGVVDGKQSWDFSELKLSPVDSSGPYLAPYTPPPSYTVLGVSNDSEIGLVFENGMPLSGEPIVEALGKLLELVTGIVDQFEAHFLGSSTAAP